MAVKTSATPGLVEAKFKNPSQSKKAYKFEVVATYSQLKSLMGQTSLDRYLLGGESDRWDLPKRKERDLEHAKSRKQGATQGSEDQSGFRDDSIPTTAEQILPDENVEDEEVEDETTRAANEAEEQLRMDTSNTAE